MISHPCHALRGGMDIPGDKSISHRAVIMGALSVGATRITGLLESGDVLRTVAAVRALGVDIERTEEGTWLVHGVGIGGLCEPDGVLDFGNSGTGARLLMGLLASQPMVSVVTGDVSLRRRPMDRVVVPLKQMGASFEARSGMYLPITVRGTGQLQPIEYRSPVASAQVKSAVLLAGLNAPGITSVVEPMPSRDHTERMLRHMGVELDIEQSGSGQTIRLTGQPELTARDLGVPADPSSAAFPVVAALLVPGSAVTLESIGLNPGRTGLYESLTEMGADLVIEPDGELNGEPIGRISARTSKLKGIEVPANRAPAMIDEYPVLAVAAAFAEGTTIMRGLSELRVKESDRLASVANALRVCGVEYEMFEDGLAVHGLGKPPPGGGTVETNMDHRIAMAFLVFGAAAREAVTIDDGSMIDTSFPGFASALNRLGARIKGPDVATEPVP